MSKKIISLEAQYRKALSAIPLHFVLILACVVWMVPSVGLFISSFRPKNLIAISGWWEALKSPFAFTLDNYIHVISRGNMGRSFINSLLIAVPATVIPIFIAAAAAYAFAWMRFPLRKALFLLVVALIVVPLQMTMIPVLRIFNSLGLTGSFTGIWLAHTAYGLPFAVYLLRNFIAQLPPSMIESAEIDGASHPLIFLKLIVPTSIPAISSLAIFQFMWVWNDLLIALVYLGGTPDVAPMTVTIGNLVNSYGGGWEYLTAAAFISMVLPLVVFFGLQQYFVKGVLAGSVKE
ncbi:carbohydrate ABC transporter permease [Gracilinema caldarium]|uniref:carbohydrate ABC transporter permease n=1 Tax=Gracilinema caldarium TaxID=215591 RepID=UPI0026EEFE55|nr:carbohydrate ABC transporter permease [Gracilinema caldarium]